MATINVQITDLANPRHWLHSMDGMGVVHFNSFVMTHSSALSVNPSPQMKGCSPGCRCSRVVIRTDQRLHSCAGHITRSNQRANAINLRFLTGCKSLIRAAPNIMSDDDLETDITRTAGLLLRRDPESASGINVTGFEKTLFCKGSNFRSWHGSDIFPGLSVAWLDPCITSEWTLLARWIGSSCHHAKSEHSRRDFIICIC